MCYIKIPNKEVLEKFIDINKFYLINKLNYLFENNMNKRYAENFINGILEKDVEKINENLSEYLKCFSPYQLFIKFGVKENVYLVLLMQIFIFFNVTDLTTEENSGNGRYDFGFPNGNNKHEKEYILIEVKAYNIDD